MADYGDGPGADLTSSSELSFEMNGVGMGRRHENSTRANFTLGDFIPNQVRRNAKSSSQSPKIIDSEINPVIQPATGSVWTTAIRDPGSNGVIVGSWNNRHPFFGRVTRFESFDDTSNPIVKDFKSSGCNKLVTIDRNIFAAGFFSGNIILSGFNLKDDGDKLLHRHYDKVTGLEASFDHKYLVSCGKDKKISLINAEDGVLNDEIRESHADGANDLSPAPDNNNCVLTCGQDGYISIWDWRKSGEGRTKEVATVKVLRTPTAIHWSTTKPNLFYVGVNDGSLACFDTRDLKSGFVSPRILSPNCRISSIKPVKDNLLAIVSERNVFEIVKEVSLVTTYISSPVQGIIEDIVDMDDSKIYSLGSGQGFTKHHVTQDQTTATSESD